MIKHKLNIHVEALNKVNAEFKRDYLEQLSSLDLDTLAILAEKSKKKGISKKLKQFQNLI